MAKSKSQKKQSKQQKQQGGAGAAEHALNVFGDSNSQRAVSEVDNTIAMRGAAPSEQVPAAVAAPAMKGGKNVLDSIKSTLGLGSSVDEQSGMSPVAVGGKQSKQQLQKTIKKQLKQLKQQGGSSLSFSEYSASPAQGTAQVAVSGAGAEGMEASAASNLPAPAGPVGPAGPTVPTVPSGPTGPMQNGGQKSLNLEKGFFKAGDKMSKQQLQSLSQQLDKLQKQQGGVGLNEIVVPLVLLYASQKYAQGKTAKKNAKAMSKAMRKSRRFTK